MVWTAFEIVVNLFQGYMIQKFMECRLHISRNHKQHDVLCVLAVSLYCSIPLFIPVSMPDAAIFLIPLVYAWSVCDDPWYVSVFWTAVVALLFLSIISLMLHIFSSIPGSSYEKLMSTTSMRIDFVLTTNAFLALAVYLTSKMKKDYSIPYWPMLLLFLLTNAALFIVEEALYTLQVGVEFYENTPTISFLWAYVGLCTCTILIISLFHMMSQSVERETRYKAEVSAIEQSHRNLEDLEQVYQNLLTTKHDLKQHVQTLEKMVQSEDCEKAKEYLKTYQQSQSGQNIFLTGATGVDALLMTKSLTMMHNHLCFHFTPYPLTELPISEPDFCTIVGNLLDNAIEGCLRIETPAERPTIQLTFSRSWDMFYIFCKNPCNEKTIINENGRWKSSKDPNNRTGLHAIGIRSIEHIAHEAEGRCSFEIENNIFSAKIVLPYIDSKE